MHYTANIFNEQRCACVCFIAHFISKSLTIWTPAACSIKVFDIWQTEYHSIEMISPSASKDVLMILMMVINGAQIHFDHFVSRQFEVCVCVCGVLWWSNCLITRQLIIHSDRLCFTISSRLASKHFNYSTQCQFQEVLLMVICSLRPISNSRV